MKEMHEIVAVCCCDRQNGTAMVQCGGMVFQGERSFRCKTCGSMALSYKMGAVRCGEVQIERATMLCVGIMFQDE